MVRTGRGMCYVIRFHKLLELVIAELWSIITNNDVWDSIFGNRALHLQVSDSSVASSGHFDK